MYGPAAVGFVFTTCAPGSEGALKEDVARATPALRLAFSRPGLVTFKIDGAVPDDVPRPSAWARVWGASLGRAGTAAEALAWLPAEAKHLHVFARDPDDEGAAAAVAEVEEALRAAAEPGRFIEGHTARHGELIADVILDGSTWLLGVHRHGPGRSRLPGGALPVEVPADAPSRAYAKIEEAIAWAELPIAAGHVAVEVGSAPGGAAFALARRGVTVWGVDPGAMDPAVLAFVGPSGARVHHVKESLAAVRWEALPRRVDWLLLDVNLAPQVAIHGLARLVPAWKKSLRGAVLTLKMNDAAVRRGLPGHLARIRELGFPSVEATHLPSNRNELCVIARRKR
jgi:23S rRNA (cytidine2498-2'-O)-methyltransferase